MACMGNMPSFKYVTVANLVITYNDTPYPIKTFVTNKKYIIWNTARPYQLEDSDVRPNSSLLEYLIVINDKGKPTIIEHENLLYSFDQTTNGSNLTSSTEYNALKSQVKDNTTKFNLISNTVDDMTQIIGSTEELEDGTIIYNLNKVKSDSESYGISIGEIQTKIDDKYAEIKPIILNDLIEYLRSVSEYKLSFTNVLEDTLITEEELALINTNKINIINKLNQLQTTLDNLKTIIDSVNDSEKSQLIINIKTQLTTLHNGLVSMCDSYLLDNKISGEEKTNIIQKTYELSTYIGTVQNTCSNITVNGQAGVVYSIENELLMLKDKTSSTIKDLEKSTNGLTETVKTQTSDITQMKDDIKLKVEKTEVDNSINEKLTDYSTTTQMQSAIDIKAGNILSTVGETYLSKGDATNTYATQSSVSQTSKDIITKFTSTGGYNKVYNSAFLTGDLTNWENLGTCTKVIINSITSGMAKCLKINATGSNQGVSQTVSNLVVGKKYTLSALLMVESGKAGVQVLDNDVYYGNYNSVIGTWENVSVTFTAASTSVSVRLSTMGGGTEGVYFYTGVVLAEGELAISWSPNPSEIYDGIITMNKSGITVSMEDGDGSLGYSKISYEGIATYDSEGNTKSWFGTNDSAYIKELNVDNINNPYIVQGRPRATSWYVGQTETGDGTGRNTSNKSNSVQSILEYIRETYGVYLNNQNITIYCDSGVNLNENINITGWLGAGVIRVYFGVNSTFTGWVSVKDCMPYVVLTGESTGFDNNDGCKWYREDGNVSNVALYVRNSNVYCTRFKCHKEAGSTTYYNDFAYADYGATLHIDRLDLVKYWSIIRAFNSHVSLSVCRGDVGIVAENVEQSTIIVTNKMPIFDSGATIKDYCCHVVTDWILGNNSLWMPKKIETTDPEQPVAPSKSWNWVEKTFYFKLSSTTEGSGLATSGWSDKWGQGRYSSYKAHRGHAIPTQSISEWCKVGSTTRNISMTLTMTRLNTSHGSAGAVPIPKIKQKDGTYWNSGVAFARGDTKSISLSSGIVSGLSDGTLTELTMWAGSSTSDYSQYNTVKLKVKCEKYY